MFTKLWLAAIIAALAAVRYAPHFVELVKRGLANEWPYNTAGVIGIIFAFFLYPMASIAANFAIANVTGFHPSFFPNSCLFLSALTYMFLLAVVLAAMSGIIALLRPSDPDTNRAFPVAFSVVAVGLIATTALFANQQTIIDRTEDTILALDFGSNSRFENGFYTTADGKLRMYGTKVCAGLPFHALLAPHPQGGFIVASRRLRAAKFDFASLGGTRRPVDATRFIYTYVKQEDCADIQAYYEYFENQTLRMRSENYRKRRFE
ncbi:hypothetical protein [Bradyrhizobium iriomotense]|uniref:hypothetical protein n=1 Tax=Bradyrhizobium iriomotense TaxID=441950 RepID=UPI0024E0C6D9|nr:hypothetical protein [Bradyrhizobium iriomotense]